MRDDTERRPGGILLIAALSGRALATAARASGFQPIVIDFFLDSDTRRASHIAYRMGGPWKRGFRRGTLLGVAETVTQAEAPSGFVYGAGFEDRPRIIDAMAARYPLAGNDAGVARAVKRPLVFAAMCRALDLPHPDLSTRPQAGPGWLRKRAGGAGGTHVTETGSESAGCGVYWQRQVDGVPVSAMVLGNGTDALVLGFSEQWVDPAPDMPFRYGGAVRPAPANPYLQAMADTARRLAVRAGLRGLNSVDFLVGAAGYHVIEVNPRPGASLDVFAHTSLMRLHVEACRGVLPPDRPGFLHASAARVVYAPAPLRPPRGFAWPEWSVDRDTRAAIPAGDPFCTVLARADTALAARALVDARANEILEQVMAA